MQTHTAAVTGLNPDVARTETIAQLNDDMRRNSVGPGKRAVVTRAVNHLGPQFTRKALAAVADFNTFTSGTNVHRERDYGAFVLDGQKAHVQDRLSGCRRGFRLR